MMRRKERILTELYTVTQKLAKAETTPILKGSFRIQGPVDEVDVILDGNMNARYIDGDNYNGLTAETSYTGAISGTCNVCATPCSSCMHLNCTVSAMESKMEDESSNEVCEGMRSSHSQSKSHQDRQIAASEIDNFTSSIHDSISGHAESNSSMRICTTFEDVEVVSKLPLDEGTTCAVSSQDSLHIRSPEPISVSEQTLVTGHLDRCLDYHEDSLSYITGKKATTVAVGENNLCAAAVVSCPPPKVSLMEFQSKVDFEGLELSTQLQGELSQLSIEHVESSLLQPARDDVAGEHKSVSNIANDKSSLVRDSSLPSSLTKSHSFPETDANEGKNLSSSLTLPDGETQNGDNTSMLKGCNIQKSALESQIASGAEHSGLDLVEDEVKVCDICGDAGREELLAICSKCSDGAEHTYCMRVMLNKLPKGDWLCEGCKLKEDAEKKSKDAHKNHLPSEKLPSVDRRNNLNESPCSFTNMHKLDDKPQASDVTSGLKVTKSALIQIKNQPKSESFSKPASISTEMVARSPGRSSLSREGSFKNVNCEKVKQASYDCPALETCQSFTGSTINSSRMQEPVSKGVFSRPSTSSSLSQKSNIKHMLEDSTEKQKLGKEFSRSSSRKEGLNRNLTTSISFKGMASGLSNAAEFQIKLRSLSDAKDLKALKVAKEEHILERSSFGSERSTFSPSSTTPLSMMPQKSDSAVTGASKGSESQNFLGAGEIKGYSMDGSRISDEKKLLHICHKEDIKPKGNPLAGVALSSGGRSFQLSKHRGADNSTTSFHSLNTSAARSLKGDIHRTGKLQEVSEAAALKVTDRDSLSSSSCQIENLLKEDESIPSVSAKVKNLTMTLSSRSSVLGCPLLLPVIPEYEYIWQGSFEVQKNDGKFLKLFNGIQAHLSNCASPRVLDVVSKFPQILKVEEVPRMNVWPMQFQEKGAMELNIALYLFAQDLGSYETSYKMLIEHIIKNELALKGNIDGVEFLVFSSNKLPEEAHYVVLYLHAGWNSLFYMWIVFREARKKHSRLFHSDVEKKFSDESNGDRSEVRCLDSVATGKDDVENVTVDNLYDAVKSHTGANVPSLSSVQQNGLVYNGIVSDSHYQDALGLKVEGMDCEIISSVLASDVHRNFNADENIPMYENLKCGVDRFSCLSRKRDVLDFSGSSLEEPGIQEASVYGMNEELKDKQQENEGPVGNETDSKRDAESDQKEACYSRKRSYLDTSQGIVQDPGESSGSCQKTEYALVNGGSTQKKMRRCYGDSPSSNCLISKIVDPFTVFLEVEKTECSPCEGMLIPETFVAAKKSSVIDLFSLGNSHSTGSTCQTVSLDERLPDFEFPSLELALGAKKHVTKERSLPTPNQTFGVQKNISKTHDILVDDDGNDAESASLSLSLAFPFSSHKPATETVSETERLFPESRPVNTSLLLFGGSTDA